jgi:hypothetical protein
MKSLVALLLLASTRIASAQQTVPNINVTPTCKEAAKGSIGLTQDFDSCVRSEEAARDTLAKQWTSFRAADRESCYRLTTTGTPGTYTELLTCLEMKRDARALPDSGTIGQGIGGGN